MSDPRSRETASSDAASAVRFAGTVPVQSKALPASLSPQRPAPQRPLESSRADLFFVAAGLALLVLPTWFAEVPRAEIELRTLAARAPSIDVRRAPWYEWTLLPGIGEARARHIVAWRQRNGGFTSLDDLRRIPRMPKGWLDRARRYLSIDPVPVPEPIHPPQ